MNIWKRIGKNRLIKTVALGTVLAVATVAPGGGFVAGATGGSSSAQASGGSFDAFISALADEVIRSTGIDSSTVEAHVSVADAVRETVEAHVGSGTTPATHTQTTVDEQSVAQLVAESIKEVEGLELPSMPPVDMSDQAAATQAQEAQFEAASTADVIAALLALLTSAQPQVMNAIDLAEAAVMAKLDDAKAQIIAAFAQASGAGASGLEELQAFAIQQIDAAKVMIAQVFDQIRALVTAAFNEARDRIIEELTGIDFGDAVDEVLGEIAAIQTWLTNALAGVQALLEELGTGLPLP